MVIYFWNRSVLTLYVYQHYQHSQSWSEPKLQSKFNIKSWLKTPIESHLASEPFLHVPDAKFVRPYRRNLVHSWHKTAKARGLNMDQITRRCFSLVGCSTNHEYTIYRGENLSMVAPEDHRRCSRRSSYSWGFPKIGVPLNHPFRTMGFSLITHPASSGYPHPPVTSYHESMPLGLSAVRFPWNSQSAWEMNIQFGLLYWHQFRWLCLKIGYLQI